MTQAADTDIRDLILGIDKKLDVFIARTNERFNAIDQRFTDMDKRFDTIDQRLDRFEDRLDRFEDRLSAQDTRLWSLIVGIVLALFGLLAKLSFFSTGQL